MLRALIGKFRLPLILAVTNLATAAGMYYYIRAEAACEARCDAEQYRSAYQEQKILTEGYRSAVDRLRGLLAERIHDERAARQARDALRAELDAVLADTEGRIHEGTVTGSECARSRVDDGLWRDARDHARSPGGGADPGPGLSP